MRSFILIATAMLALAAYGQEYPIKPVRIIVSFAPAGPNDLSARPGAAKLQELLGQPVVIDYRPGANGIIGNDYVAKSPSDGYTLLLISTAFTINPSTYAKLPFDTIRDFAPVSLIAMSDIVFIVNPTVPAHSVKEFVVLAKSRPGRLNYASSGTGGSLHLGAELLKLVAGLDMVHVPYKGAAPALMDVVGGHVDSMFVSAPPAIPQIRGGKARALGVASARRATALPDVPTFAEAGFPKFEVDSRYGLVAPAGTPREVIAKLHGAIVKALATKEVRERYASIGLEPASNAPEEYAAYLREDIAKWHKVVAAAKLQPQ